MLPLPSAAELEILAALWKLGQSTVREVHDFLDTGSGYTTTLKQMQVMIEKGLLLRSHRDRSHVYASSVPKEQTQKQIAADMLQRAFEGSAKNLVLGALEAKRASAGDLAEIRQMIAEYARKRK